MARILCLAPSGFGKTTGIGQIPELGFKGLDPKSSYILSITSKPLPFHGSAKTWPVVALDNMRNGHRVVTKTTDEVVSALNTLYAAPPIKNVVLDDMNYLMQDWYMKNALRTGWDAPKKIGYEMGRIFDVIEKFEGNEKNIIVLAHGENVPNPSGDGRVYTKLKTTGKMVDEYITPEGKFDIVLVGRSWFDSNTKKIVKEYITNEDAQHSSPKSPIGMFPEPYVPNDLGKIVDTIQAYYHGEAVS